MKRSIRSPRLTLRDRVTLVAIAVLALALAVASIAGNLLLTSRLNSDADDALRNRAAAQRVTLEESDGKLAVRESSNDELLDDQSWVFDGDKAIVEPRASRRMREAAASLRNVTAPTFWSEGEKARLLAVPVNGPDGERRGAVVVGVSLEPYERAERSARLATILIDLFALIAAAVAVRWSVGRALRPVHEMTDRAAQWSEEDLDRRFEMGEPYDEITGLAATLDNLLGRIDAEMRREQRLTAEIAHELRTPLAGIRAEAELALRNTAPPDRDPLEQIIASTDRTNAAIDTLLAAHTEKASANRWCDASETIAEVAAVSAGLAGGQGVSIDLVGDTSQRRVEVDANVLAQTLSPVLDNAIRHAQSRVEISLRRDGSATLVRIADDGAGLGGADPEEIFHPGVSAVGGAGLGLPLARRLAQTFGGQLRALAAESGAAFELRIPDSRR